MLSDSIDLPTIMMMIYIISHFYRISQFSILYYKQVMSVPQSQLFPEEVGDNDNQFLPNNSQSYHSIVLEHEQRRSLILGDNLSRLSHPQTNSLQPSNPSNESPHQEQSNKLAPESFSDHWGKDHEEEDEENQFMLDQNSLAASINVVLNREASGLNSKQSKSKESMEGKQEQSDPFQRKKKRQQSSESGFKQSNLLNNSQQMNRLSNSKQISSQSISQHQHQNEWNLNNRSSEQQNGLKNMSDYSRNKSNDKNKMEAELESSEYFGQNKISNQRKHEMFKFQQSNFNQQREEDKEIQIEGNQQNQQNIKFNQKEQSQQSDPFCGAGDSNCHFTGQLHSNVESNPIQQQSNTQSQHKQIDSNFNSKPSKARQSENQPSSSKSKYEIQNYSQINRLDSSIKDHINRQNKEMEGNSLSALMMQGQIHQSIAENSSKNQIGIKQIQSGAIYSNEQVPGIVLQSQVEIYAKLHSQNNLQQQQPEINNLQQQQPQINNRNQRSSEKFVDLDELEQQNKSSVQKQFNNQDSNANIQNQNYSDLLNGIAQRDEAKRQILLEQNKQLMINSSKVTPQYKQLQSSVIKLQHHQNISYQFIKNKQHQIYQDNSQHLSFDKSNQSQQGLEKINNRSQNQSQIRDVERQPSEQQIIESVKQRQSADQFWNDSPSNNHHHQNHNFQTNIQVQKNVKDASLHSSRQSFPNSQIKCFERQHSQSQNNNNKSVQFSRRSKHSKQSEIKQNVSDIKSSQAQLVGVKMNESIMNQKKDQILTENINSSKFQQSIKNQIQEQLSGLSKSKKQKRVYLKNNSQSTPINSKNKSSISNNSSLSGKRSAKQENVSISSLQKKYSQIQVKKSQNYCAESGFQQLIFSNTKKDLISDKKSGSKQDSKDFSRDYMFSVKNQQTNSTVFKKKEESTKDMIFNTFPEEDSQVNEHYGDIHFTEDVKKIILSPINQVNKEKEGRDKFLSLRVKDNRKRQNIPKEQQKSEQIQRIKLLKESQKKRLQRQLQKVKKQLQQINLRQKHIEKIYEQKQKIQKGRQSEEKTNIHGRHKRESEAVLKLVKQHRKTKDQDQLQFKDIDRNITNNLMELSRLRHENQQKNKQMKRMEIVERMKKNQIKRLQEQKLIKANNHYVQQFKSADPQLKSPTKDLTVPISEPIRQTTALARKRDQQLLKGQLQRNQASNKMINMKSVGKRRREDVYETRLD